ncbi:MAG: MbnP family protein [Flavobacterium sp.]|uniref:MbnP family protein n=1 Tax=Flavobacterium sp. TaxID=239 RepID=UPI003267F607
MTKKGIHIVFLLFFCFSLLAQNKSDSLAVNFHLEFDKLPLEVNKKYVSSSKDTLTIETFRCYISNIQVHYNDKSVFTQKDSYHLLDLDKPNSFKIPITKKSDKLISKITFNIGIDSVTNNSGALTGDLDPAKGMYWAWQSGYINMKIEGKSSSCKTQKNEFQFHVGGYLQPYYAMRTIEINGNININIGIDLNVFFSNVNLKQINSVMIPGKLAMELANLSTKMFHLE